MFNKWTLNRLHGVAIDRPIANGKSDPPPPPDYTGAAQAQGAANVDTARIQGKLNNPSFSNPYGQRQVTFQPDDSVNIRDTLTPEGQARFNQENRITQQVGNVAEAGVSRVGQAVAQPFDTSKLPGMTNSVQGADAQTRQRVEQALIARQQPYMDRQRSMQETQLANQGIMKGSEAWRNAQDDMSRAENDARLAAIAQGGTEEARQMAMALQSGQFGNQARQQGIQEQSYLRSLPLNELNALRTGAQVGMPQFQAYQGAGNVAAPNLMGATQAGYDAQVGNVNASNAQKGQTTAAIGSAAVMAMML